MMSNSDNTWGKKAYIPPPNINFKIQKKQTNTHLAFFSKVIEHKDI